MSDKNSGHRPPDGHKKKDGGSRLLAGRACLAAAVLALCWCYATMWAPLHIDPQHNHACLLYKSIAWVVSSPVNKVMFACMLALPFILGLKLKAWAPAYYRLLTIVVLVVVAGAAWDLSSPGDYFTSLVDRLLAINYFGMLSVGLRL